MKRAADTAAGRSSSFLGRNVAVYDIGGRRRRGNPSATAPTRGRLNVRQQSEWQAKTDLEGQMIRDGLSASSQRALDEIQQPQGLAAAMDDDGDWEDLQDPSIPMDSEITLTAEGDEVEVLREISGTSPPT